MQKIEVKKDQFAQTIAEEGDSEFRQLKVIKKKTQEKFEPTLQI